MEARKYPFIEKSNVFLIHLESATMRVQLTNYGATVRAIYLRDANGKETNVVLGYDSLQQYIDDKFYVGSTLGRVGGRISNGEFYIGADKYSLARNDGATGNHLHGGKSGLNKKEFSVAALTSDGHSAAVTFHYLSPHMEEGYPGNVQIWVTYILTSDDTFSIHYKASTDKATHLNLTNHSYFNLTGIKDKALSQELMISGGTMLQTDENYIPDGKIVNVLNTPYDFITPRRIDLCKDQLSAPGYNEYYILNKSSVPHVILHDRESGRTMSIQTSYPGILFYSGDYLEGKPDKCEGICLEAQFFPDTPNRPEFKGTLLLPGELYEHYIHYRFTAGSR